MGKSYSEASFEPGGLISRMILPPRFRKRQAETRFKQRWVISTAQYLALMAERFKGPRYQRGNILIGSAAAMAAGGGGAAGGSVVITNIGLYETNPGFNTWNGIRWNDDGSIDERGYGTGDYAQVHLGEWWSDEPETDIGDSYDVRALSGGSGSWNGAAASDNTWIQIGIPREWFVQVLGKFSPDIISASRTWEIRDTGSGSALDDAVISCTAEN